MTSPQRTARPAILDAPDSTPLQAEQTRLLFRFSLVGYLATVSAFLTADPQEREEALRAVHELASGYGDRFPLPRLTYVFAFARLAEGLS